MGRQNLVIIIQNDLGPRVLNTYLYLILNVYRCAMHGAIHTFDTTHSNCFVNYSGSPCLVSKITFVSITYTKLSQLVVGT